jgi:hypothetical protein
MTSLRKEGGSRLLPVLFPAGEEVVNINKPKCRDVSIYTEMNGKPVYNYCDRCNRPFCAVLGINNSSIMTTAIRVYRCDHTGSVVPYVTYSQ